MIKKQHLKTRPVCKLTFELSPDFEADEVAIVGTFSNWEPVEFNRLKSGKWKLQLEVEPGSTHQFRYMAKSNGDVWYDNDGHADDFVYNEFGTQNAVIHC